MPRTDQFVGFEFDWPGVDQHGHVAVFISWGWGPLPAGVDQHLDEVDAAMERIQELPAIGPPRTATYDVGHLFPFWDEYAAKGFYVYHWDGAGAYDESRRYHRYIAPPVLINVSRLPPELQAVAHFAEFTVTFADAPQITIGPAAR
jgi:hypothetical protein